MRRLGLRGVVRARHIVGWRVSSSMRTDFFTDKKKLGMP